MTRLSIFALLVSFSTACSSSNSTVADKPNCESTLSVLVNDYPGNSFDEAVLTFKADGEEEVECSNEGDGEYTCSSLPNESLEVFIRIDDVLWSRLTHDMSDGECATIEETLSFGCTDAPVPAVLVNVFDSAGDPVDNAFVGWTDPAADMDEAEACTHVEDNQWSCADDRVGPIEIVVDDVADHEFFIEGLNVLQGGCGPYTEVLDAHLESI